MHSRLCYSVLLLFVIVSACKAAGKPLPPTDAPKHMSLPAGFQATLFAGEPDVRQPIAFTFDDRGRLWVAECYSYPQWIKPGQPGRDRILIFEDRDGDGRFDTCKVFTDKIANISGLQVGFGGVYVCAIPHVLFIPDHNGDDIPDGPAEVLLDGWDMNAQHNVFNSLTWGPDGWLYGCNGILSNSRVGKPGTPDSERIALNCGVWRYHPTRRQFEVVATGTTNPWGLDFDDYGQMFITNCVIHHLWHVIPGAHYQRMFGQDFNRHWYALMESCADHIHWGGGPWQSSRGGQGTHNAPGGGHAHSGAMVYLGDNWPERYRNGVFMCNLHGNRINHDILERQRSGYVARHGQDFMFAHDPWFRGLALQYGPDGGVFVTDWCDTGECHNYKEVDRSNGRIYKLTYGKVAPFQDDLAARTDEELVKRQLHKNDWHVRHARRILQERAAAGRLAPETHALLHTMLRGQPDSARKLRALWALHVTGGLDANLLMELLGDSQETLRGWAVRLALEGREPAAPMLNKLAQAAAHDSAAVVRLELAAGLQRLPLEQRWPIADGLIGHSEDAQDANLPLMLWYGIEPLVASDPERAAGRILRSQIPLLRQYTAQRIAARADGLSRTTETAVLKPLLGLLATTGDGLVQADILRGIHDAYEGRRQMLMPAEWPAIARKLSASPRTEVREKATLLSVIFDDADALTALQKLVMDKSAIASRRQKALEALLYKKRPDLVTTLQGLLDDPVLRGLALRGLAAYQHEATPRLIVDRFAAWTEEEKSDAIHTLASRPAFALALLEAIERGRIPRRDVSAFTVRQLMGLKHKSVTDKLKKIWGTIRPASEEKKAFMAQYKALLTPDYVNRADRAHGRQVYARTCASCHRLFGEGGDIGPELTGSQRSNLDYVLENVLDPSAIVPLEYQVTVIELKDGRILTGIIKKETEKLITVQTQNEKLIVAKSEIESRNRSPISMMPEGLLAKLTNEEIRDLVAYLASASQAPK